MMPQCRSFCKTLYRSHVSDKYLFTLPMEFDKYMPLRDSNFVLVDESEREFHVLFRSRGNNFTDGWKYFVTAHGLLEGDDLYFDLIAPCKFKVSIIRASGSTNVEPREINVEPQEINAEPPENEWLDSVNVLSLLKRVNEEIEMIPKPKRKQSLPKKFCDAHLPCDGSTVILVDDETQREYSVTYSVKAYKLLGGWKKFARECGLLGRDIVVFQLVDRCKFKVHIIRTSRYTEKEFQNNMP